jgi:hypothetical protein
MKTKVFTIVFFNGTTNLDVKIRIIEATDKTNAILNFMHSFKFAHPVIYSITEAN